MGINKYVFNLGKRNGNGWQRREGGMGGEGKVKASPSLRYGNFKKLDFVFLLYMSTCCSIFDT